MANNLNVKVTADVQDLQSKFAVAKAEVAGLSAELNRLARASAAGMGPEVSSRLQQVSGDFIAAKTQANALGVALGQASGGLLGINASLSQSHGSISTATREFRALFDELSSGRTRQTPGTLAIIAQRVLGLGPAALGATAGVMALVGGLGYLGYRAIEASNALDHMKMGAEFAGNLNLTRAQLEGLSDELAKAKGVSAADAREIVGAFASMHNMSAAQIQALTAVVKDFSTVTGEDATKAGQALVKIFSEGETAEKFAKSLGGVAQTQINMAEAADKSGDAQQVFSAKLDLLDSVLQRSTTTIDKHNSGMFASIGNFFAYSGMLQSNISVEQAQTQMLDEQNTARAKQVQLLQQLSSTIAAQPPSRDQTLKTGVEVAEKENPVAMQVDEAKSKIAELNAALQVATERGDQVSIDKLNAGLAKAKEELSALQFGPVLERMRADMERVATTWDGTQSNMLARQIQIGEAALASVQKNSKEGLAIQQEVSRLEVQARQSAANDIVAVSREEASAISADTSRSALQRLEAERDIWQQTLSQLREGTAQYKEVQRALNADLVSIAREGAQEQATIARQDAAADIAIARMKIEAAKSAIDLTAAADKDAVAQKLATLRQLTAEEFSQNEAALENELSTLNASSAAYNQVYNQIRELKARLVVDLANLDRQAAQASAKENKEQASAWKGAVGEIEGAEEGMVSDLLNKRKSLSASLLSIGAELVTKEIANDLRAVTTRLLLQNSAATEEKALQQGGFVYHQTIELMKTATTHTQQAAQTTAVAAGASAQNAAQAAAQAAGRAQQAAIGPADVMAQAAMAFAGTYASVSSIPVVGWAAAPAAAAEAFAAVSSMAGLASLDVGTNYVARGGLAVIHEGEAVVPKQYNPAAGGAGGGGDVHLHNHFSAFDASGLEDMVHSSAYRDEMAKSLGRYINRGGRG